MKNMQNLDPIELPLNCTALIEASAGTGKTFTMANLYLRLLLGVGCQPMSVEQILVVTFTTAATEELRDRIRRNIKNFRLFLENSAVKSGNEDFFNQLSAKLSEPKEAILRLKIAEREMDLASIFTIHSFCQKMLFQYAFNSGMRFDCDLQKNQDELLLKLSREVWRSLYYPMPLSETMEVAKALKTPESALKSIKSLLSVELPQIDENDHWLDSELSNYLADFHQLLNEAKHYWITQKETMLSQLQAELGKTYKTGAPKVVSRNSYKKNYVASWIKQMDDWANGEASYFPAEVFSRFTSKGLAEKREDPTLEPLNSAEFEAMQQFADHYQTAFDGKMPILLHYQFLHALKAKLLQYKATHSQKSFDDMLFYLNQALKSPQGETLAKQIRQQFSFAMIDEFQDTDKAQYEIFAQIFMQSEKQGFIMIGDPKQSIYKFRGADIFTYLTAAKQAKTQRTLENNWRSLPEIVRATNQFFKFHSQEASPFLYEGIQFQEVKAKKESSQLVGSSHLHCYLSNHNDEETLAAHCASLIQAQLKQAEENSFGLQKEERFTPFKPKDFAVLVRTSKQGHLIKEALAKRGIASVFLSESRSVYDSDTAWDLLHMLKAVLYPQQAKVVLSAIGTGVWSFNAQEIYQLKNDEQQWDQLVSRLVAYQKVWQTQGVLVMLHQLFIQESIFLRIQGRQQESERRLTDLFHLTELLQSVMPTMENESALLRWYERQLTQQETEDEQVLRLESEAEIIKIVTIHGSKGLQYPVVWLPFIGVSSFDLKEGAMSLYRDEQDKLRWQFGKADESVKQLQRKAEYAEDLRLLYVAMTRAESQMNMILPTTFSTGWNAVSYLLTEGKIGLETEYPFAPTESYFAAKQIPCQLTFLPAKPKDDEWRMAKTEEAPLQTRTFTQKMRSTGNVSSFSALHEHHQWRENVHQQKAALVFDETLDRTLYPQEDVQEETFGEKDPYSAYYFPHSSQVGTILHRFFERHSFQQAVKNEDIFTLCEALNLSEEWVEPTKNWLQQILNTPFTPANFSLNNVPEHKKLTEWQFYLRLKNPNALTQLNRLLAQYHCFKQPLFLPELEGYIRGFVDCLVQVEDKFYVIDYKSNFLGYHESDYRAEKLAQAMEDYRYDLQYLLYSLAVHRYLKSRLGEQYQYEKHFGGVAYLFLRGMQGEAGQGVFFDKPAAELIEAMDQLFVNTSNSNH